MRLTQFRIGINRALDRNKKGIAMLVLGAPCQFDGERGRFISRLFVGNMYHKQNDTDQQSDTDHAHPSVLVPRGIGYVEVQVCCLLLE